MGRRQKRVGIYAGTFDPVHAGHIAFALQALKAAKLDKIYFMPERQPRRKRGVEHFGHRVGMLRQALKPHPKFEVLELVDVNFSVVRTLPKLQRRFSDEQLVFLFGSDAIKNLPAWPGAQKFLNRSELVVGLRHDDQADDVRGTIKTWYVQPQALRILTSYAPDISSGKVRDALYHRIPARGLLQSVARYSNKHWLYVSVA